MPKIECRISSDGLNWSNCPLEGAIRTIMKCCLDDGAPVETVAKLIVELIKGNTVSVGDTEFELEIVDK